MLRAFAISVVFHLLLLWPAATVWEPAAPAAPLIASLRPGAAHVSPVPLPAPHQAVPPLKLPVPVLATPAAGEPQPVPAPDASHSTTVPVAGSEAPGQAAETEPRVAVVSALPPSAGLDAEGLRSYRMALAVEARRHKRYPARAIEEGRSGTTELRISRTSGQGAPLVQVVKSSGYPLLDEAALDMVRKALPATPVPASLRDRNFAVDLPIVFDLPQ